MPKKLLLYGSNRDIRELNDLFTELYGRGQQPCLLGSNHNLAPRFKEKKWPVYKFLRWPRFYSPIGALVVLLFWPFFFLISLLWLALIKKREKCEYLLGFSLFDAVTLEPGCRLLKIPFLILELPGYGYQNISQSYANILRLIGRSAKIAVLNEQTREILANFKINSQNILTVPPGIKLARERQENLFTSLVQTERQQNQKKFFSLGTTVDLATEQEIEVIFQAIKKAMTVIPEIQLIIVGDGPAKKGLEWLARKMEISNVVWFVGRQTSLNKWLSGLDLYIAGGAAASFADITAILGAGAQKLPVIAPLGCGLDGAVIHNRTGLMVKKGDSEDLAQAVIRLKQNIKLRQQLGQAAKERVERNFTIERMADSLVKLLDK